jgi:predicted dehydrogenase/threonine dehydrogenase-like Zn-dependent dehydrogenase
MKQVLIKKGQILVEDVPAPGLDDNSVLVETAYSLISVGTETSSVASSGKSLIQRAIEQPKQVLTALDMMRRDGVAQTLTTIRGITDNAMPTGYSCAGVVLQVGKNVTDIRAGMKVACAGAGRANHAEVVSVPRNLLVEVPDDCELSDAASVTLGAIAMQGVRRADPRLGEVVAVIGLGLLGQITVQLLKAAGCKVVGIELDERRIELAKKFGLDIGLPAKGDVVTQIKHHTGGRGADSVIITAASSGDAIVQQAMEICRRKGKVVVVGAVGLGLKRSPFYEKEIDFLISTSYGPGRYDSAYELEGRDYPFAYVRWTENRNMQAYLQLVAEGKVKVAELVERRYALSDAAQAFAELQTSPTKPLGVLLEYKCQPETSILKSENKIALRPMIKTGKIGVAVIGAGSFAQTVHLPNLQRLSNLYHVRAVVNATGNKAKAVAEQFRAEYASTSYEEVLADPNVDMVLICTRHHLHAAQAMAAAKAGKAILLEKPMALTKTELAELTTVLEQTGVPFMVGYNRRFSPYAVEARRHTDQRINPLFMRYRMNAGYIPLNHWVHGPEGGGRIVGEACHIVDLFSSFTRAKVESVSASRLRPTTDSVSASDNVSIHLTYADGSVGVLDYFALGSRELAKENFEIHFDEKTILIDDYKSIRGYGVKVNELKSATSEKGHLQELEVFEHGWRSGKMPVTVMELSEIAQATFEADDDK